MSSDFWNRHYGFTEYLQLEWHAFEDTVGGEIYVKKITSMNITDIAKALAHYAQHKIIGIRHGAKLHEQMISPEDSYHTYEYPEHFKILPAIYQWSTDSNRIEDGRKVPEGFTYAFDTNAEWMDIKTLQQWIETHRAKIGEF